MQTENPFNAFSPEQQALLFRTMQHYINDVEIINAACTKLEPSFYKDQILANAAQQSKEVKEMQKLLVECTSMESLCRFFIVTDYLDKQQYLSPNLL